MKRCNLSMFVGAGVSQASPIKILSDFEGPSIE